MHIQVAKLLRALALAGPTLLLAGCMDGPFFQMAKWNPYYRKQWAADESYRPTYYTRMESLADLRTSARRLDPATQQRVSAEMVELLRNDSNPLIRRETVRVLAELPNVEAAEGLRQAIGDSDSMVRVAACEAWQRRGGDEGIDILANLVGSDTDQDVRMAATRSLAEFRDPRAVRALGLALDDADPALQYRAMQSLAKSTGKRYGDDLVAWREFVQGGSPPERGGTQFAELLPDWF
ncbi:MAG: HEAT repeat domain-containing protein [Pirellulaceae bacterium]